MNGCQFDGSMAWMVSAMNTSTTATLTKTITPLTLADSLMPITSSVVTSATITTAGTLNQAVTCEPSASVSTVPRAAAKCGGMWMPRSPRNDTTYPVQPIATVVALSAYSSTRSHPMIQAMNSPSVA